MTSVNDQKKVCPKVENMDTLCKSCASSASHLKYVPDKTSDVKMEHSVYLSSKLPIGRT